MHRRQFSLLATSAFLGGLTQPRAQDAAFDAAGALEAYLAAWNRHDADAILDFYDDRAGYFDASVGRVLHGKDEIKAKIIDNYLIAVPDCQWVMAGRPFVQGEHVSFRWQFSGTNSAPWADGTQPTGRGFSFSGQSLMEFADGLIHYQVDYYDASALFAS